jgi:DNA-directed RNA polymerase subunit RPC12/RpoP
MIYDGDRLYTLAYCDTCKAERQHILCLSASATGRLVYACQECSAENIQAGPAWTKEERARSSRACGYCGETFQAHTRRQIYCCESCKSRAMYRRQKQQA